MTRRGAAVHHLTVSEPVADALATGVPVVALETTVVAHGLPFPLNVETVGEMTGVIQREGAVPALIAVLDGRIRVGMDSSELERIAHDDRIAKASARDVPVLIATGASGATTVAGTMYCARLAGIAVFATGGIGGVHRGASSTFDVSADLHELATTPVAVVCSGAKSILDVPRNPRDARVARRSRARSRDGPVPRFPRTGQRSLGAPFRARRIRGRTRRRDTVLALGRTGVVIANPVPASCALDRAEVERFVREAERRAHAQNIAGKALTPFLLEALAESSDGATLRTNRALLVDNARAAAEVARHLAAL